jgi:hypothetical protein
MPKEEASCVTIMLRELVHGNTTEVTELISRLATEGALELLALLLHSIANLSIPQ